MVARRGVIFICITMNKRATWRGFVSWNRRRGGAFSWCGSSVFVYIFRNRRRSVAVSGRVSSRAAAGAIVTIIILVSTIVVASILGLVVIFVVLSS